MNARKEKWALVSKDTKGIQAEQHNHLTALRTSHSGRHGCVWSWKEMSMALRMVWILNHFESDAKLRVWCFTPGGQPGMRGDGAVPPAIHTIRCLCAPRAFRPAGIFHVLAGPPHVLRVLLKVFLRRPRVRRAIFLVFLMYFSAMAGNIFLTYLCYFLISAVLGAVIGSPTSQ